MASQPGQAIVQIAGRILQNGHLSHLGHLHLATAILSDYRVTDAERSQVNRVFDDLQMRRIKLMG